ncbi:MAG: hypothetical protein ABI867_11615 [Kofleriaceae bacterium]
MTALVQRRGAVEARRDLAIRLAEDPKDLAARLALAALDDRMLRPSAAIDQLEAVLAFGGPIGTRWHADDRARLGRLLAARGRVRLARGAATALADLERARDLGAAVLAGELRDARIAGAITQLRHVDGILRARGKRTLAELAAHEPIWAGARAKATVTERAGFGVWLWGRGAKRAAWDELRAWHDAVPAPRDAAFGAAYLEARTWWSPSDAPPPELTDLVGPLWCRYAKRSASSPCEPAALARAEPRDDASIAALLAAAPVRATTPADAMAWLDFTLVQALRGETAWGPAFVARVDIAAIAIDQLAPPYRAAFAILAGRTLPRDEVDRGGVATADRLVFAAGLALRGAATADIRAALGSLAETELGRALLRVVEPAANPSTTPYDAAAVAHVRARVPYGPDAAALQRVLAGYRRDPAVADRIARDVVAEAPDAAAAQAALGTLFVALADPARARAAWQAAVDASPEPAHLRGLADALARARDPDAAMIIGTGAAAAAGDPAVVWLGLARALHGVGEYQHALEAARSAIDLAAPDLLPAALEVAIEASHALGRDVQVDQLRARRATLAPPLTRERDGDPSDAAAALADHRRRPTVSTLARLWVASRWSPRDVSVRAALLAAIPTDDPRRAILTAELVALAADRDPDLGRASVAALR